MPILGTCTAPGCKTVTIGERCVAHDEKVEIGFVRGRPFGLVPPELGKRPFVMTVSVCPTPQWPFP